jgi:hypothetical protein
MMMMVRPTWAGAAIIALFPAIMVVLDSSSTVMHPSRGGTDKNFEKQNSQKIKFEAGIS